MEQGIGPSQKPLATRFISSAHTVLALCLHCILRGSYTLLVSHKSARQCMQLHHHAQWLSLHHLGIVFSSQANSCQLSVRLECIRVYCGICT